MVPGAAAQAGGDSEEGWEDGGDPEDNEDDPRPPVPQRPTRLGGGGGVRSLADGPVFVVNPDPPPRTLQEMANVRTQEVMLPGGGRISLSAGGGSGIMMMGPGTDLQARGPHLARARAPAATCGWALARSHVFSPFRACISRACKNGRLERYLSQCKISFINILHNATCIMHLNPLTRLNFSFGPPSHAPHTAP